MASSEFFPSGLNKWKSTDKPTREDFVRDNQLLDAGFMPIGSVTQYAGSSAPTGWLLCEGQQVSRDTYAGLFAVIGTTYGSGDGSTTFNLPNLAGRFPLGSNANHVVGSVGGAETHTLTKDEIPSHSHLAAESGFFLQPNNGTGLWGTITRTGSVNVYSAPITGYTGGSAAHNNMPPFLTLNYIIKI